MDIIKGYIDMELLMIIGTVILLFILFNLLFKKVSMPIVLKRIIISFSVVLVILLTYNYFSKQEKIVSMQLDDNYVVGRVEFVGASVDKIRIEYLKGTLSKKNKKSVIVNVKSSTRFLENNSNKNKKISIYDLKLGDVVTVYFSNDIMKNNNIEITATKVIKRK